VSEAEFSAGLGRYSFAPTQEDATTAASRWGLRAALGGRLALHHVAPLVAFALAILFVAILTLTGLIGRGAGEGALILAAIAFMAARLVAHWRLRRARQKSLAAAVAAQADGEVTVHLEDAGLLVETAAGSRRLRFADCVEAELAGGIVYLWPRAGAPAFIPEGAFADEQAAQAFLALLRQGIGRAERLKAVPTAKKL
jgi:hypothetical protein